jgi:hypothetical protein
VSESSDSISQEQTTEESGEGSQARGLQQALTAERKKRQELESRLAGIEAAQREAQEAEAKRRGQFEDLYETASAELANARQELADYKQRESDRLERIIGANQQRLAALPETFRALVPDGLAPDLVAEQISKLEAVLVQNTPTGGIPPRTGKVAEDKIPTECIKEAERYGYTDARNYYNRVWKPRMDRRR